MIASITTLPVSKSRKSSMEFAPKAWTEFAGFVGRECAGVVLAIEAGGMFLSLATGFSTTTMGAEELMPFSLPRVAFTGVSLDNPAPGAVPFIRVPLICVGAFVSGVCVAVGTGVVTPPAQEETEIFLGWCIPGSHPGGLYLGVMRQSLRAEADSLSIFNGSTGFHRLRMRRSCRRKCGRSRRSWRCYGRPRWCRLGFPLVQPAPQRFDFFLQRFHFRQVRRRGSLIKLIFGRFGGRNQFGSHLFFCIFRQQCGCGREFRPPKSRRGFSKFQLHIALGGAVGALSYHLRDHLTL